MGNAWNLPSKLAKPFTKDVVRVIVHRLEFPVVKFKATLEPENCWPA